MSRIDILLPSLHGGGVERNTMRLIRGFLAQGHYVRLILFRGEGEVMGEIPEGVRLQVLGATSNKAAVAKLFLALIQRRPDVLLAALDNANQAAVIVGPRLGIRTYISIRNTLSVKFAGPLSAVETERVARMRALYPRATGIIACALDVASDAARFLHLSPERVMTIYNPVVTPELLRQKDEPTSEPWLQESIPVIVGVGRLTRQKDFDNLIRAFAEVRKTTEARLLILGEGEDRPQLEELIASLGLTDHVKLPGFVSNPFAVLSRAAVFVLSSRWEGLPTVLIEAIACGTPVVSTDCPSGPREILQEGRYGRIVPTEDSPALAAAILATLRDGKSIPSESLTPFKLDVVTDQYLKLLVDGQPPKWVTAPKDTEKFDATMPTSEPK